LTDLSYNAHINNIVAGALQRSITLFRGFASRNLQLMRKAFVTYIRPILRKLLDDGINANIGALLSFLHSHLEVNVRWRQFLN